MKQLFSAKALTIIALFAICSNLFSAVHPLGDLDYNAQININDLKILADQWLECEGLEPALLAYWKFDSAAGWEAFDVTGNHNGIIHGAQWIYGKSGSALNFSGDDYIEFTDFTLSGSWTISFWVKMHLHDVDNATGSTIFGDEKNTSDFFYMADGLRAKFINSTDEWVEWTIDTDFYNKWRFVILVARNDQMELFLDGISQGTKDISNTTIIFSSIATGHNYDAYNLDGSLDDFHIFSEALTDEQIWLLTRNNSIYPGWADLDSSGYIDNTDFSLMANNWQKQVGPVIINEVMASNQDTIKDDTGQSSDWIELYNPTDQPIDVAGLYLTDNLNIPNKWQIPTDAAQLTTIQPHDYLLIWADEAPLNGPLHTNFSLSSSGEQVGLFESDGLTMIDSVSFDDQLTDVSFGRSPDASPEFKLFPQASTGSYNNQGFEGFAEKVIFSHDTGIYFDPFVLELASTTAGAEIRYTTDETEPTINSPIYSQPLQIDHTTILRTRAFKEGLAPSEMHTQSFIFAAEDVQNFTTNLPLIIMDTHGKTINGSFNISNTGIFIDTNDLTGQTTLSDAADYAGRCGIRIRGSSSAGWPKKQYAYETWDEYDDDKNVSIFGFPTESDWIVHGPYADKTLMRNYLSYNWSNKIGQYAPRVKFAEAFLNDDGGDLTMEDYIGVYVFMEKIKRDDNRVDITELSPTDNSYPEVTGGYILKKDRLDPGDSGFGTTQFGILAYVEPKESEITPEQADYI